MNDDEAVGETIVMPEAALSEPTSTTDRASESPTSGEPMATETKSAVATAEPSSSTAPPILNYSHRRLIVTRINKYLSNKQVTKMTNGWVKDLKTTSGTVVEIVKIKKPPKDNWTVLTLADESMVQPLIDYVNNQSSLVNKYGEKIAAKKADEVDDNSGSKRKAEDSSNGGREKTKRQRVQEEMPVSRRPVTEDEVRDKVTPLWKLSTEEQVTFKMKDMIKNCAMKVIKEVKSRFRTLQQERNRDKHVDVYEWVKQKRSIEVQDLIQAPTPLRNKTEFTFGYRYLFDDATASADEKNGGGDGKEHGKVPAVGFMATGWSGGVSSPHCCANIPSEVCAVADVVNDFLTTSPLLPYDTKTHSGFWRILTVRSSRRTREVMIIVVHAPMKSIDGSSDFTEHFEPEKERLVSMLKVAELPVKDGEEKVADPLKVTSLFFQEFDGLSSPTPDHPVQHVFGKKSLQERLGKCSFEISPGAFFQVNTGGAELLYETAVRAIREVSPDPEKTLLFDVCCGTGTIGITCLKEGVVGRVVGVDISAPAIADAKVNAELNGFGNDKRTRFVAARAEHVLAREIAKVQDSGMKIVAVVDPARDGLHTDVLKTLRQNIGIDRVVYVSCNPTKTLVRDAALLCSPPTKRYVGVPFRPVSASPVDMFPLTNHCEMVMVFDRLRDSIKTDDNKT